MQDQTAAFVEGSSTLVEFYGYWISFHDAAVETVQIEREAPTVTIAFTANDAVLKEGQEDRELLANVTMRWHEVLDMTLSGVDPDENNWIGRLSLERKEDAILTTLSKMHGVHGAILARRVEIVDVQAIET
jgi:hypothetical protein